MATKPQFESEAALVAAFTAALAGKSGEPDWTVYAETAGWDLLLVHKDGYQLGVEAKLKLNPKVLSQALSGVGAQYWGGSTIGPDYRAVLVPEDGLQHHMEAICRALGIGVITVRPQWNSLNLPDERRGYGMRDWSNWCPEKRCAVPDYVPDVEGGHKSPVTLTPWKVKAIKLLVLLERRGYVTRADMKALAISPTLWTAHGHGFLKPAEDRPRAYVRSARTPDLRAQHPVNFEQIAGDVERWSTEAKISLEAPEVQGELL